MTLEEFNHVVKTHKCQSGYLKDHTMMLHQFEVALADEWPPSDKANPQHLMASKSTVYSSNSGSKWLREMVEESDLFNEASPSK